jgi:DNA damage-binding protein 1
MGDSHLLRINSTPVSDLDSPTLVIPTDITTTPISLCSSAAKGKGKADSRVTQGQGYIVDGQGKYVSVLETYKNIAPISDAVLVDIDGGGQANIIPRHLKSIVNTPRSVKWSLALEDRILDL